MEAEKEEEAEKEKEVEKEEEEARISSRGRMKSPISRPIRTRAIFSHPWTT
jgi:hypothetical protein